jgi:RNA polymerase sigma-70 factor (ECF subfamily)
MVPGQPIVESVWVEPYPDDALGMEDGYAAPEARYERRESVELAFIAALQHLAPNQRAVLILREVLGFSARETAEILETTVASANSALQRARAAVEERIGERSQQQTLRALGDDALRELIDRYVEAWESCDIDTFVSMLTEDATFSMPPLATWYRTREGIATWARLSPMSGDWRWRALRTVANGQPALAFYAWDASERAYLPFALNVLSFRGEKVVDVTAFIVRSTESDDPESYERFPEQPFDERRLEGAFTRFGLPERLTGDGG